MSSQLESQVDPERLAAMRARELAAFRDARPRSTELQLRGRRHMPRGVPMAWMAGLYDHPVVYVATGEGAAFTDVDGHQYLDMNLADSSAFCGFAPPAVTAAVTRRMRAGAQFLLADEDSLFVAEELATRFGMPKWQLTLSATQANVEAIRLARTATGRHGILVFDGKYHGMIDETLATRERERTVPEYAGLGRDAARDTLLVAFNDIQAVRQVLAARDIACVLTEPALTNLGLVLPDEGFHEALAAACRATGTVLIVDEAHTLPCGPGGLTRRWGLVPDILTLGKSIGGGVPIGAYGMRDGIADLLAEREPRVGAEVATGGTCCGSALQTAACRATLEHVLTEQAYADAVVLGARLAAGIGSSVRRRGLDWSVEHLYTKTAYRPDRAAPRTFQHARDSSWHALSVAVRLWFANRGVWEAIWWSGPAVSVASTEGDVDRYLLLLDELLEELSG